MPVYRCPRCARIDAWPEGLVVRHVEPAAAEAEVCTAVHAGDKPPSEAAREVARTKPRPVEPRTRTRREPVELIRVGHSIYRATTATARRREAIVAELREDHERSNAVVALLVGRSGHAVANARRAMVEQGELPAVHQTRSTNGRLGTWGRVAA